MKKKLIIIAMVIVLLAVVTFVIYKLPVYMLRQNAAEISYIDVFDGKSGIAFTVDNKDDVDYIVTNISSVSFRRDGLSLGRMGYGFRMTYYNKSGDIISSFILNGKDTIRKDPFFYMDSAASLCYEYVENIETTIAP